MRCKHFLIIVYSIVLYCLCILACLLFLPPYHNKHTDVSVSLSLSLSPVLFGCVFVFNRTPETENDGAVALEDAVPQVLHTRSWDPVALCFPAIALPALEGGGDRPVAVRFCFCGAIS